MQSGVSAECARKNRRALIGINRRTVLAGAGILLPAAHAPAANTAASRHAAIEQRYGGLPGVAIRDTGTGALVETWSASFGHRIAHPSSQRYF
ncbi:hypothetical protein GALL_534510 [mine drainage metagenome]|uniref:Uncharacterized protein n=1 Tax=mine drainage metagenome TaxID=410659 RepID=A0A1J5P0C0_9ZZZZ